MSYSVNLLTTAADCDALLAQAGKERAELAFQHSALQRLLTHSSDTVEDVTAELTKVTAKLDACDLVLGVLPDGPEKEAERTKRMRYEVRQRVLTERLGDNSPRTRLDREFDQARLAAELNAADAFIAAIQARKSAL
jgi:hypothetical protein